MSVNSSVPVEFIKLVKVTQFTKLLEAWMVTLPPGGPLKVRPT